MPMGDEEARGKKRERETKNKYTVAPNAKLARLGAETDLETRLVRVRAGCPLHRQQINTTAGVISFVLYMSLPRTPPLTPFFL